MWAWVGHEGERRRGRGRVGEVEHLRQVPRCRIPLGQGREAVPPLDELEGGGVVGHDMVDRSPAREGGQREGWYPEPGLAVVEAWAGVVVVGEPGGLDVVEEPAPLVVGDDQRGLAPCGRGGDGCGDLGQQRLSAVDVGMWVVVVGAALSFTQEGRVDVGEAGSVPEAAMVRKLA